MARCRAGIASDGARGHGSMQPALSGSAAERCISVAAEDLESSTTAISLVFPARIAAESAGLELAQYDRYLVLGAVARYRGIRSGNVLSMGQQSDLPNHWKRGAEAKEAQGAAAPNPGMRRRRRSLFRWYRFRLESRGSQGCGLENISLRVPANSNAPLVFSIDSGDGGRPDLRAQLTLKRATEIS